MTEQEIQELRDIQGFIDLCIEKGWDQGYCLGNIGHDCGLLLSQANDGSSPRTADYAKYRTGNADPSISSVSTGEGRMP